MDSIHSQTLAVELATLDAKVNALLPARYQHCYTSVAPTSMGSAGLKYDAHGQVAWAQIWTTFCDLALAGGPPHRGKLLEPVAQAKVATQPEAYARVVAELDRAIGLTTGLLIAPDHEPGWIGVQCDSPEQAAWLQFAVIAENVSARRQGAVLLLPAGPDFRVEKEIKNVVVAITKGCHYWDGHLTATQKSLAGARIWQPATPQEARTNPAAYEAAVAEVRNALRPAGLPVASRLYTGWVSIQLANEEEAVWLLRAVLADQVLARREERVLYLPVGATPDADQAAQVGGAFCQAWRLWTASQPRRAS